MKTITQKPETINAYNPIVLPPEYLDALTKMVTEKIQERYILVEKNYINKRDKKRPMSYEARVTFIDNVISQVCAYFEITLDEFYSIERGHIRGSFFTLPEVRYVAMRMCRKMPAYPIAFAFIGNRMGGIDHSTVQHGNNKCGDLIEFSPYFRKAYAEIEVLVNDSLK